MTFFIDHEVHERTLRLDLPFNQYGIDPFGISRKHLAQFMTVLKFFYEHYFSVRTSGIEHVPASGRAMLIGNHSGGIPIDGAMIIASVFLERDPPRLVHGMVEKFFNRFPIASPWGSRTGQLTGLPEHSERLLENERLLMVFPEGARGTAKLFWQRYSLVQFGTGFMRLALKTGSPIVPFAVLGGGDAVPTVTNLYTLGKMIGLPYIPLTPYLLPVPLPARVQILYGEPLRFSGTGNEEDTVINTYVDEVKQSITRLLESGRSARRRRLFSSGTRI